MTNNIFNIYYINYNKAVEIAMLIDNRLTISEEYLNESNSDRSNALEAQASGQGEVKVPWLSKFGISSKVSLDSTNSKREINKLTQSIEVKNTKSTLLRIIMENLKSSSIEDASEGQLIRIDGLSLKLRNEVAVRTGKFMSLGALKGKGIFGDVDGIDTDKMSQVMFKDYFYFIEASTSTGEKKDEIKTVFKIPMTLEGEFENNYSIDDLLLGKVSIVGIYKGLVKGKQISDIFKFFLNFDQSNSQADEDIEPSVTKENDSRDFQDIFDENNSETDFRFIDVISVLQQVKLEI
ncbi:DUF6414 family protein [Lactococcus lactis]|uniref:DUF6414 family protein n=1 Tax=Lactococcus lactis TaxID=1358 RepID=UPI0025A20218|nr:DUF6414 family protein [Lactococcus lactis]